MFFPPIWTFQNLSLHFTWAIDLIQLKGPGITLIVLPYMKRCSLDHSLACRYFFFLIFYTIQFILSGDLLELGFRTAFYPGDTIQPGAKCVAEVWNADATRKEVEEKKHIRKIEGVWNVGRVVYEDWKDAGFFKNRT